jgi:hypothetical protein
MRASSRIISKEAPVVLLAGGDECQFQNFLGVIIRGNPGTVDPCTQFCLELLVVPRSLRAHDLTLSVKNLEQKQIQGRSDF